MSDLLSDKRLENLKNRITRSTDGYCPSAYMDLTDLLKHIDSLSGWPADVARVGHRAGLLEALEIAEGMMMIEKSPIGPLHGAGWNDAVSRIITAIKEKTD